MATVTRDLGTERELEPELDSDGWLDARGVVPGQDRRPISTNHGHGTLGRGQPRVCIAA